MKKISILLIAILLLTGCNSHPPNQPLYLDYSKYEKVSEQLADTVWCYSCDLIERDNSVIQDEHVRSEGTKLFCDGIPIADVGAMPVHLSRQHNYKKSLNLEQLMAYAEIYYANLNNIPAKDLGKMELEINGCRLKYAVRAGKKECYLIPVLVLDITGDNETTELMIDVNSGVYYVEN